ncbi:MAG: hypothetical protein EGP82_00065, partial [Odoribacter splanchnicus]|nr:hypothetical protein [Odoribacter splanchnicus]
MTGNNCLLGQIATFRESLGFSYDEIVRRIPYQNLLVMQMDKLQVKSGDEPEVKMMTGREMLGRKRSGG